MTDDRPELFCPADFAWIDKETFEALCSWKYPPEVKRDLVTQLCAAGASSERADWLVGGHLPCRVTAYLSLLRSERVQRKPAEIREELKDLEEAAVRLFSLTLCMSGAIRKRIDAVAAECGLTNVITNPDSDEPPAAWQSEHWDPSPLLKEAHHLMLLAGLAGRVASMDAGDGRPVAAARKRFVRELSAAWLECTGCRPTSTIGGPFWTFAQTACRPVFDKHRPVTDDLIKEAALAARKSGENPA